MNHRLIPLPVLFFSLLTPCFLLMDPAVASADVPADYTGTPYGGTPRAIPGRIDFEDFDEGGQGVGWDVDDHTGNFGEEGCPGNSYRNDPIHPELCKTNIDSVDAFSEGPMTGSLYPSEAMPQSIYVGYAHADDWVNVTVDVKQAGTYALSSTWGSEAGGADQIGFEVSFNDVVKATVSLPGTGGYHNWVQSDDFARVELDAGVQVLKFRLMTFHLNYDYLQFSLVLPDGSLDDGSGEPTMGPAGAGGMGGASAGGAGGMAAGGAAQGGDMGLGGMGGMPDAAGSAGMAAVAMAGSAGATTVDPLAGAMGGAAADSAANRPVLENDAGCSLGSGRRSQSFGLFTVLAFAFFAFARRHRR